ncbi:hypothetical protein [Parasitella parasitica]|uniref:RBR-type E3 ubiquitin transferase n=1 Tax=Parasitella parasitica TaxID=35722 RepID=A0A0B7ND56_9FUNG|nr:hypothetical protein [Parasitella parasitica]
MSSGSDFEDEYMSQDESDFASSMSESEGYNSNDDINDDVFKEKQQKKAYQVDYNVLDSLHLKSKQDKEVSQVSAILGLSSEDAATLLRYFRWNKEKLFEQYMDSSEKVLKLAGVSSVSDLKHSIVLARDIGTDFMCDICCDDSSDMETISVSCGHRFCRTCYTHYVVQKIREEGESRRIQCPDSKCAVIVDEKTVELLVDSKTHLKYRELLNRTFVDDNDFLRWCPAPDCEYAIECTVPSTSLTSIVPTVECKCTCRFCFGCGLDDHQPCICVLVKKWLQKCEDDSETANWISVHTKECPKCRSTIEKNGGCNHMTCRKCIYEFCWVCMGPWSEHGTSWYTCNRYDEKSSEEARDNQTQSRASLERYLHYYNRYANHEQSAKLDQVLYKKTEKKMEEMQQTSGLSWIEVQFLKKAVDVTVQCRTTLKWTYAFAFYLDRTNETELFEDNQRDLEMATEQLSELLERPLEPDKISELKQAVLDKSVYVKLRREILLEDTAKGLQDGRWSFFVDLKICIPLKSTTTTVKADISTSPLPGSKMNDKTSKRPYPQQQSITTIDEKSAEKERLKLEREKLLAARKESNARFKTYLDSLPELMYPNFYKVDCIGDLNKANERLSRLGDNEKIFGVDLEWPPTFVKGQREKKTSLVQICSANSILLLQIGQMKGFPSELKRFFEDKTLLKSGVNIGADGLKLYRDFGIKTNGLVELRDIAESIESSKLDKSHLRSLRALTGIFLDQNMPKGKVRLSNWNKEKLTAMQVKYAANDAYASYKLYIILDKMRDQSKPINIRHLSLENLKRSAEPTSKFKDTKTLNEHPVVRGI